MRIGLLSLLTAFLLIGSQDTKSTGADRLEFSIKRPDFIVRGRSLSKVEIWIEPTGTGLAPGVLREARLTKRTGLQEVWSLRIPDELSATRIFAQAYDKQGKLVARRYLPYTGVGAIDAAIHGPAQ
jgi:hypothetical protein